MVLAAYSLPSARSSGLGASFREGLGREQVLIASLLALGITLTAARSLPPVLLSFAIAAITVVVIGRWAARRLGGGITGDVYGALCELSEVLCLLGLSLWASA